jgi:uncharacterized damage-inducible protein DinB
MLLSYAAAILDRDLRTLRREVEAYPTDGDLWTEVAGLPNVAGTLALHLVGNLQHYIGAQLGQTGYIRDRAAEFSRRDVPRAELVREIEAAREAVRHAVAAAADTQAEFPELIAGKRVTTGEYLIHLLTHFAYHLGQLDYHRRIVTGKQEGVGAVRPAELSSARG